MIILAPLIHITVGYGPYFSVNGTTEMYAVMGPTSVEDGQVYFEELAERIALHEFIHSYVNPLTDKYFEENPESRSEMEPLMAPIFEKMRTMAYGVLEAMINEHIIRAIECFIGERYYGMPAIKELERQEQIGFIYIKHVYELIEEYYAKRKKVSFNEYHQKIMILFKRLAEEVKVKEYSMVLIILIIIIVVTLLLLKGRRKIKQIGASES